MTSNFSVLCTRNIKTGRNFCATGLRTFICACTVKPVLSGHLKIDKTKVLKTNGNLMKVEHIAECSPCG